MLISSKQFSEFLIFICLFQQYSSSNGAETNEGENHLADHFIDNAIHVISENLSVSGPENDGSEDDPYPGDVIACISKCCPLGMSLSEDKKTCTSTNWQFFPQFESGKPLPKAVKLETGLSCKNGRYRLEPEMDSDDEFHLLNNGSLFLPYQDPNILSCSEYCLESFLIDEEVKTLPLICFVTQDDPDLTWVQITRILYPAGCLISIPFLLITLTVYLTCPELRTTNGKVLSCHIACLAIAYSSLSTVQIAGDTISEVGCLIVAFMIQFSFLASFFWLNVLCFNTWRRLRYKLRSQPREANHVAGRRFVYYSIYGWGAPIFFLTITLVMDLNPSVPTSYLKPNFGFETCWFQDDTSALSYFYAPIATILAMNLILFVMSAFSVWTHHKMCSNFPPKDKPMDLGDVAIQVIRRRRQVVFVECLMLFLIMGLNWVWEVISWRVGGPQQIWFITDLFNTLQGLIVFYAFVWRDFRACRHLTLMFKRCFPCFKGNREAIDPIRRRSSANSNNHSHYMLAPTKPV